ncbi:MAG: UbiA family prenyltransferase [Bacteroidota bacterium]
MLLVRRVIEGIIYSNIFIGICAVALTLTNQVTVEGDFHFNKGLGFVFFSTVFTYCFLKFRKTGGAVENTTHHNWAEEHQQLSRNILVISLLATVFYFAGLEGRVQFVVALLAAFTALYGFVNIPFTNPKRKLRDFGLLKTVFVAIVWSVTTVVVPLGDSFVETDVMIFLLLRRFLFILALTIPFEIKDMVGDREHNLKTIPYLIGVSNTKLLAQGILLLLALIIIMQHLFFGLSIGYMLALDISLLLTIFCIQPVDEETSDWWFYVVLDGMMVLQFVLVYTTMLF